MKRMGGTLLSVCLLLACSGEDSDNAGDGGTSSAGDGPAPVTEEIGPEGGTLQLGALTLNIPEGALSEPVEIGVAEVSAGADLLSPVYELTPEGLQFEREVQLLLRTKATGYSAFIFSGEPGGPRYPLRTRPFRVPGDDQVAAIYHFSHYWGESVEMSGSFCPRESPLLLESGVSESKLHPWCALHGEDEYLSWSISELGVNLQPSVTILYTNKTDELILNLWFEVKEGDNVSTLALENERYDDYTQADGHLLRPRNYGTKDWRTRVIDSKEKRKDFWRYYDLPHFVAPADDGKSMRFEFCLGYRLADDTTERQLCGAYGLKDVPCNRDCREDGDCAEGLVCDTGGGSFLECKPAECRTCPDICFHDLDCVFMGCDVETPDAGTVMQVDSGTTAGGLVDGTYSVADAYDATQSTTYQYLVKVQGGVPAQACDYQDSTTHSCTYTRVYTLNSTASGDVSQVGAPSVDGGGGASGGCVRRAIDWNGTFAGTGTAFSFTPATADPAIVGGDSLAFSLGGALSAAAAKCGF